MTAILPYQYRRDPDATCPLARYRISLISKPRLDGGRRMVWRDDVVVKGRWNVDGMVHTYELVGNAIDCLITEKNEEYKTEFMLEWIKPVSKKQN